MVLNKCVWLVINEQTKVQVVSERAKARPSGQGRSSAWEQMCHVRGAVGAELGAAQGTWGVGVWRFEMHPQPWL